MYFPHAGIISLIVGLTSGQFVEAGMLGRNGVIGAGAPLDGPIALNSAIAQVESSGTMIETAVLKRSCHAKRDDRVSLVRHDQILAAHTQQVAACNALHELEERLSRWLLQTRDLLMSDTLAADTGVLVADAGRAAQQRHLGGSQTAGCGPDPVSARSHPGARCRRTAGLLLRVLCGDQHAFPTPGWMVARPRRAPRGSGN